MPADFSQRPVSLSDLVRDAGHNSTAANTPDTAVPAKAMSAAFSGALGPKLNERHLRTGGDRFVKPAKSAPIGSGLSSYKPAGAPAPRKGHR